MNVAASPLTRQEMEVGARVGAELILKLLAHWSNVGACTAHCKLLGTRQSYQLMTERKIKVGGGWAEEQSAQACQNLQWAQSE